MIGYDQWKIERKHHRTTGEPFPSSRRGDRPMEAENMLGYWRQENARTKADTPIAIWREDGKEAVIFQFGASQPINHIEHREKVDDFIGKGWLKCVAVTRDEWSAALDAGKWADGKIIRMPTVAEKADIVPRAQSSEGRGTNSPVNDNGEPIDGVEALRLEVRDNFRIGAETIKTIGVIDTLDKANRVAVVIETLRANYKVGNDKRKELKKPHDDAAKAIQEAWQPMLDDGERVAKSAVAAVQKFRDAEEARLKREERERREAEERRIREEEEARLRAEAEERAKQAEAMGMEVEHQSDEEIAAQAAQAAAATVEQMPEANTTVRVGTTTGRGVAKAKFTYGRITDQAAFYEACKDMDTLKDCLQQIANKLARAGAIVPGLEAYKE